MSSKVSFTIRRPPSSSAPSANRASPHPRPTSRSTSFVPHQVDFSDEEVDDNAAELVTGFDQSGAQRLHEKPKASGPMVIAPLANRDWRAIARARKQQLFIPDGADAPTGKDGSQGGLGTRDSINSGPQATGLVRREQVVVVEFEEKDEDEAITSVPKLEESEDERARKALLASVGGNDNDANATTIDAIPLGGNESTRSPMDETDAYKQDVVTRPESATLADYERVPVSQFGAALMRGMGWKEGTAASRTRRGLVEPWLPASRPALLGIGAKERPNEDIPTGKGAYASKRPERRYVPLVKMEREGSARPPPPSRSRSRSPSRSGTTSRLPSKSSSPYPTEKDRRYKHHSKDKTVDDYAYEKSGPDRDRDRPDRSRGIDRVRDRRSDRGDEYRDKRRDGDREERDGRGRDYRHDERESSTRKRGARY